MTGGEGRVVVFAKGPPRSGTTLFDLILGSHSLGASLGEMEGFAVADASVERQGTRCGICEGRCPVWDDALPQGFRARWFAGQRRLNLARVFGPGLGFYEELFTTRPGARFLVDSSKSVGWMQGRLRDRRDWRRAEPRFLLITRDGRAVINSWHRKSPQTSADGHIDRWLRVVEELEDAYAGFEGRKTRVSYEALTAAPEETAARLATFAGVDPEPAMARYWEHDHHPIAGNVGTRTLVLRHRLGAEAALPFAPSSAAKTAYYQAQGLAIRPDTRWRTEMPEALLDRFEARAGAANAPYRAEPDDTAVPAAGSR